MSDNEKGKLPSYDRLHELFTYDPISGDLRWAADRGSHKVKGKIAGEIKEAGYRQVIVGGRKMMVHRIAWVMTHGAWPSDEIDHINLNKLDNRLVNLREATRAENVRNQGLSCVNTSGVKGVSWYEPRKKWLARIKGDGKRLYLGMFTKKEDAIQAYNAAAEKYHGEFRRCGP